MLQTMKILSSLAGGSVDQIDYITSVAEYFWNNNNKKLFTSVIDKDLKRFFHNDYVQLFPSKYIHIDENNGHMQDSPRKHDALQLRNDYLKLQAAFNQNPHTIEKRDLHVYAGSQSITYIDPKTVLSDNPVLSSLSTDTQRSSTINTPTYSNQIIKLGYRQIFG